MLEKCKQRIEADATDQWAVDVLARVEDCVDFVEAERRHHTKCKSSTELIQHHFTESMKCSIKQDVFLANGANKSRFITMLLKNLQRAGNKVVECQEDADTQIVRCALELATTCVHVIVVADDKMLPCCSSTTGTTPWLILKSILRERKQHAYQIFHQQSFNLIKTISSRIKFMDWL